jgi:hypothetical protein
MGDVKIKTYEELVAPDERNTLMGFIEARKPGGFDVEVAARLGQEDVSHIELHSDVPEALTSAFGRVRMVYSYGLFEYELYTVARDQAVLLLEQALRARFITLYDGVITLVSNRTRKTEQLKATDFETVVDDLNRGGEHASGNWTVQLRSGKCLSLPDQHGHEGPFRGTLTQLLDWARQECLLTGQRTRTLDPYFVADRNFVAHASYQLVMPTDAARMIYDMGETINRLWGQRTPGGRLYPAPIERTTVIVAWTDGGNRITALRPDQLPGFDPPGEWTWLVLLAVPNDGTVFGFDASYERTAYPAELLCGPGGRAGALEWLEEHGVKSDFYDNLNQPFVVQVVDGKTYLPRRPEVALGLSADRRRGTWHLLRVDHPLDAFVRVRTGVAPAEEVLAGTWDKMAERLEADGYVPVQPPCVWVPGSRSRVAPDVGAD